MYADVTPINGRHEIVSFPVEEKRPRYVSPLAIKAWLATPAVGAAIGSLEGGQIISGVAGIVGGLALNAMVAIGARVITSPSSLSLKQ